ncbi:MAG TPA: hypothetical protein HA224_02510 [Nanoarchaeota archaeon]|nr:hypothetical protein [Nanoarchaeota archaeon]
MICPHCTKEITEDDLENQKHEHEKKVNNEFMQKLFSSMMSGKKENTKEVIKEFTGKLQINK